MSVGKKYPEQTLQYWGKPQRTVQNSRLLVENWTQNFPNTSKNARYRWHNTQKT
jgi:hypothetical protein